ncbi:hypothetical protein AVEN_255212-1 [Araneus ventricosus]|uniref:Uncharacterized protein n=1 Tax=Araneus ventricosus TaxID=182803 RepID=A0A4Y2BD75_ARAVE|nr:hypothetical protein AVEN_255212-1 [Araneus ventricosus]
MSILRDTGASIDIVSRNRVRSADFTGETVWVKQPLDLNFTCLPLAKVELQSSDFGHIVTKAAVIDSKLDSSWYLLSNKTHNLILVAKQKTNVNSVKTRSQCNKQDLPPKEEKKDPQNSVSREEPAEIVRGELPPLELQPRRKGGHGAIEGW